MFAAGIDIGSTASKAVILAADGGIAAKAIVPIGTGTVGPARVFAQALERPASRGTISNGLLQPDTAVSLSRGLTIKKAN